MISLLVIKGLTGSIYIFFLRLVKLFNYPPTNFFFKLTTKGIYAFFYFFKLTTKGIYEIKNKYSFFYFIKSNLIFCIY